MKDLFIPLGKVCANLPNFQPPSSTDYLCQLTFFIVLHLSPDCEDLRLGYLGNRIHLKYLQFLIVVECVFCLVNTPGHDTGDQKNKLGRSGVPLVDNLAPLLTSHIRHDKRSADNSSGNETKMFLHNNDCNVTNNRHNSVRLSFTVLEISLVA